MKRQYQKLQEITVSFILFIWYINKYRSPISSSVEGPTVGRVHTQMMNVVPFHHYVIPLANTMDIERCNDRHIYYLESNISNF